MHFIFELVPMSTPSSAEGGENIKGAGICPATSDPQWSSRKGLRFADYFFQEGFLLADQRL